MRDTEQEHFTLINQHNQTKIPQLLNNMFEISTDPFGAWRAPENANEQLTDQPAIEELIKADIDDVQHEKQARLVENRRNGRLFVSKSCLRFVCRHLVSKCTT